MDKELIETYRSALLKQQEQLLADAVQFEEQARTVDLDQGKFGRLSRMDALQNQQMALESKRRVQDQLQEIEGAMRRLELGDYGYCYICGEAISEERLRFNPTATRCKDCME